MNPFGYISSKIYTRLKPSKISGVGVFALRDIPSSSSIFDTWQGETGVYAIKEEELKTLPRELYHHIKSLFLYGPDFPSNTDTFIKLVNNCHWVYTTPYYFVNSSQSDYNLDKDTLLTTRDIKAGEEILSNYRRYERLAPKDII